MTYSTAGLISLAGALPAERHGRDPPIKPHETCGHLAPARVVDADEEHLGLFLHESPFHLGERLQPLASEPVREHGHEDVDRRIAEQIERLADVAGDRLLGEDARELG